MKAKDILGESQLFELDRSDLELVRDVEKRKQDQRDDTATRDEFRDKMRSREGQSVQSGDRVFNPRSDKMFVVKRVTKDGILFKGATKPVNLNVKDTGRKTNLGHRVFIISEK